MTYSLSDVTALIITIGRDPYLLACVSSLRHHYPEITIFVGDQNPMSFDRTSKLHEAGVDFIVELPWDCGVPIARNRVLEWIETPFLLLGDDDFFYTASSNLNAMREIAETYDIVGAPLFLNGKVQNYQGFVGKQKNKLIWTKLENVKSPDGDWFHLPWNQDINYWPVELTLNFFIARTESVRRVKWDENIMVSYEHTDFFLSAKQAKLSVAFTPDATAIHKPPHVVLDPVQERSYLRTRKNRDDREYFFRKWGVDTLIDFNGNVDRLKK